MADRYDFLNEYLQRVEMESVNADQETNLEDDNSEFFNIFDEGIDEIPEEGIIDAVSDPEEEPEYQEDMVTDEEESDPDYFDLMGMEETPDFEDEQEDVDDMIEETNQEQLTAEYPNYSPTSGPYTGGGGDKGPKSGGSGVGNRIAATESGGDYKATNKHSSATGKYQFLWSAWGDSIKKITGVKSKKDFLNNPQAQDKYFAWYEKNYLAPEIKKLQPYNKAKLSDEQLMRLVHFRGAGGAKKYLKGELKDKPESYNMPISQYIGKRQTGGYSKKYIITGVPVAHTQQQQYNGLNDPNHSEMIFPLYGENEFRGLDNGEHVYLEDEMGKKKVLKGPKDKVTMTGRVYEKKMQTGGKIDLNEFEKDLDKNISNYRNDVVSFYNNYIDSPKYKERLLKQGYTEKEANDAIALRKANLAVTTVKKRWGAGNAYDNPNQNVDIDPYEFAANPDFSIPGIFGHEFSHVAGSQHPLNPKIPFPMRSSDKEFAEIEKRNKLSKLKTAPTHMVDSILHDRSGNEAKADMDALRYMMYKDKFFDTGTQDFNKDLLKKAKKKYSKDFNAKRFFKNFSDDDIIYMMNSIAKNDSQHNKELYS